MNSLLKILICFILSSAVSLTCGCEVSKESTTTEVYTCVVTSEEIITHSEQTSTVEESIEESSIIEIEETTIETVETYSQEITEYLSEDETSAIMLAKLIYGEARGVYSVTEQACIAWTVLNRVDNYGESLYDVVTSPNQFAYSYYFPTIDDYGRDLVSLARDILGRWEAEKQGYEDVGRVLPSDYMWYAGDGYHNYFRNSYEGGCRWDYSLPSPYEC